MRASLVGIIILSVQALCYSQVNFFVPGGAVSGTTVPSNGYVGLGTNTPISPLHLRINSVNNINEVGIIIHRDSGPASGSIPRGIGLAFQDGLNSTFVGGIVGVRANPGSNFSGDLAFFVNPGVGSTFAFAGMLESMRLASNGNVGIGTASSPTTKLQVKGGAFQQINTDNNSGIFLDATASDQPKVGWRVSDNSERFRIHFQGVNTPTERLAFYKTIGGSGEVLSVLATGKVGIGTESPGAQLEVVSDNTMLRLRGSQFASHTPLDVVNLGFQGSTGAINVAYRMGYPHAAGVNGGQRLDLIKTSNGNTIFATGENGSALGRIGIGTTNPQASIEIRGESIRLSDDISRYLSISQDANGTPYGRAYTNGTAGGRQFKISGWSHKPDNSGSESKDILHFDGYNLLLLKDNGGSIGIGTALPDARLTVKGTVHAQEVKVDLSFPAPDYVFEPTYHLPKLDSIKEYIEKNKHLPEVPSAKEMETNGINLGEMNMLLLKKIEELTLYVIEQSRELKNKSNEIEALQNRVETLEQSRLR